MQNYNILLAYSPTDECYVTAVPALPGCMSDGHTIKKALDNTDRIIQEWLDNAKEHNEPIPEPDGKELTLVPTLDQLFDKLKEKHT